MQTEKPFLFCYTKANLRLVVYDIDAENNTKQILSAKEQEVFIGDLPLMTQVQLYY